jgi:hypothetical protein
MWGEGTVMTVRLFLEEVVSDEGGVVVETLAGGAGKGGANIVSKKEGNGKADGVRHRIAFCDLQQLVLCKEPGR